MKATRVLPRIQVTADGEDIVTHAGSRLLAEVAEAVGLTAGYSKAMAPIVGRPRVHDPGKALVDLAVMAADGGDCLADLKVLRANPEVFGAVASDPTVWRVVDSVTNQRLDALWEARAAARAAAWGAGVAPGYDLLMLDLDATLVNSYAEKIFAAPTYKRGFGYHPLVCYLDATGEALYGRLRRGSAGSNTAGDHILVVAEALAQLPVQTRAADPIHGKDILLRADSASATHEFLNWLRSQHIGYSVGYPLNEEVCGAICGLQDDAWAPCVAQDGIEEREGAQCAEVTQLLDLSGWPEGTRLIVRREDPHPGAQFSFTDVEGHRFTCFLTDSADDDLAYLEARHRGHARVEDRIREGKATGLRNFPFHDFAANATWLSTVLLAQDLVAWAKALCLPAELAAAEPKRLRYALWHAAGRLVSHARQMIVRLDRTWPWAKTLEEAFITLRSLPLLA